MAKGIKTREERLEEITKMAQTADCFNEDAKVVSLEDAKGFVSTMFVDHVLDGTIVDGSEDYVIVHTHESKCNPMSMNSNYTREVIAIFTSKVLADKECSKDQYAWRGNGTGSVSWDVVKRSEVTDDTKWKA